MYKKIAVLAVLLSFCGHSYGQAPIDLIGKWNVYQVKLTDEPDFAKGMDEKMDFLKQAFASSVFEFKEGGKFTYQIAMPDLAVENGYWKYDPTKQYVSIYEWEEREKLGRGMLMGFNIHKDRMGRVLFAIYETPFVFVVNKQE